MNTKIKIGQVWLHVSGENRKIVRFTPSDVPGVSRVLAVVVDSMGLVISNEAGFTRIYDDTGLPTADQDYSKWSLMWDIKEAEPKPLSRECLCGIFRGDCEYHR